MNEYGTQVAHEFTWLTMPLNIRKIYCSNTRTNSI